MVHIITIRFFANTPQSPRRAHNIVVSPPEKHDSPTLLPEDVGASREVVVENKVQSSPPRPPRTIPLEDDKGERVRPSSQVCGRRIGAGDLGATGTKAVLTVNLMLCWRRDNFDAGVCV